jgi:hypothetical protein
MRVIQNSNLAFRCPNSLKQKLVIHAEQSDVHVSELVRTACIDLLKREAPHLFPDARGPWLGR